MAQRAGGGWLQRVALGAVVILAVVILARNLIVKAAVTAGVKAMTGLDLSIAGLDVGLLKSAFGVTGLVLNNPAGFADRVMIDLPEVYAQYDLPGLLRGRVHLPEVRVHLKEFVVVRNADGRLNLDALKVVQDSKARPAGAPAPKPAAKSTPLRIDRLHLQVGTVVYKDYTGGGDPKVQTFALNLDERHEHIDNPQLLASLIVSRALMNTAVARLTGLNLTALQSEVTAELTRAAGALTGATGELRGTATRVTESAVGAAEGMAGEAGKEALGAAEDAVKKTGESIKKLLPIGQ
jgi:uncharacterized protein involved in outer membrane biogenesis